MNSGQFGKLMFLSDAVHSEMVSGNWSIIIEALDILYWVERVVELKVQEPTYITVTVGWVSASPNLPGS